MRKKFTVTQEDIDKGKPGECVACPVAIACERGGLVEPSAWPDRIYHGKRHLQLREHSDAPRSVSRFIKRFDNKKTVQPFSFFLNVRE